MQLPAQLQEFLFEGVHLDPKLARQPEQREIIRVAGDLLKLAAARAEMRALRALAAVPANKGWIRRWHCLGHSWISDEISPIQVETQKKWLAGAAANHLSESRF